MPYIGRIQLTHGPESSLNLSNMLQGEIFYATDTKKLYIANGDGTGAFTPSNGAPSGVFATLAALQAEYPTGTGGVFLVTDNGHWYYWNGSAWTSGGVYQSGFVDAVNASLTDAGDYYVSDNVEGALQEVGEQLSAILERLDALEGNS